MKIQAEDFFCEQNILTEGVFVIQFRKSQFEGMCWSQKKNCCFMSDIYRRYLKNLRLYMKCH